MELFIANPAPLLAYHVQLLPPTALTVLMDFTCSITHACPTAQTSLLLSHITLNWPHLHVRVVPFLAGSVQLKLGA